MKKFFPLCLLLIVAIVWTVSIAGDEGFITKSNQPGVAKKAPVVQKEKTVAGTENVARVAPAYGDINPEQREEAIARAKVSKSAGEPLTAPISRTNQKSATTRVRREPIPAVATVAGVPRDDTDKFTILTAGPAEPTSDGRMKDIKADGVISSDERAEYVELLSSAAPGVELPTPLNIVYESENNDTCDSADVISCGDTVWCADLDYGTDDNDWYTFTLTDDSHVTIETHDTGTSCQGSPIGDTYLELWTGDCATFITYNDDISTSNYYSRIDINLIAGTYAINSDATYWETTGYYHLSLLCTPCGDQPPNDDCANATDLGGTYPIVDTGTTACALMDCPGMLDWDGVWYKFDLPYAQNEIDIEMCPTTIDVWTVGPVLMPDCACASLTMCDAYGFYTCPSTGYVGFGMSFNAYPGPATVYWPAYIADGDYNGIEFEFTIDVNETPQDSIWNCYEEPPQYILPPGKAGGGNVDIEPNDICQQANMVRCETAYCGDMDSLGADWYYIDLPMDTTFALHVRVFANDTPNQYAYGGGLDPWVGLYESDCVTLVTMNEDYGGTFPDAENFDSQIDPDPLTGNCFDPGERVYIKVADNWGTSGPYLLIINCVPCEKASGACCVDEECVATNLEDECDALGGIWWIGEDCAAFVRCAPIGNCDSAFYNNGAPVDQYGMPSSQCLYDYAIGAGTADDITLAEDEYVSRIITWTSHWNGNIGGPARYDGINVTFYLDDITSPGQPGGYPDSLCSHVQTIPGGVYSTQFVPMGMVNWEEDTSMTCTTDRWMLEIHLPTPVQLLASTLYWLEIQPIMAFSIGGQSALALSELNIGADAIQWWPPDTLAWITINGNSASCPPNQAGLYRNIAFCLIAPPPAVWSCLNDPPLYVTPDGKLPGGYLDTEPNDTCTTAEEAFCEYAFCGDMVAYGVDWYYIDIPSDTTYSLHVRVFANDTPNQYAYGGGLDPWVGLYESDCVTLVTMNEDYGGTFPDAEGYDSQIDPDPLTGNCFDPDERVYIKIVDNWETSGPYLLIINCVPCEKPTGACCVDEECVATNLEDECDALQGIWWIGEDCATGFVRCAPIGNCDSAFYNNGAPADQYGMPSSQCIYDYAIGAGTADDITLTEDARVSRIITWTSHWNGNIGGPARYDGINVTFYLDDITSPGQPGGYPDSLCSHVQTVPGGVYSTQLVPMYLVNWEEDTSMTCTTDRWMLEIHLPTPVQLFADTLYWLEIQPIMALSIGGQSALALSELNIGADAIQWWPPDSLEWITIDGNSATCPPNQAGMYRNIAFCLIEAGCEYVVGDVNGTGDYNGLDITFGVNYFKGGRDPICDSCDCPPHPFFWVCGDVNGTCNYNGLDITYGVNYFKGGPNPFPCPDCPPAGGPASNNGAPEKPSVIKSKTIFEQKPGTK